MAHCAAYGNRSPFWLTPRNRTSKLPGTVSLSLMKTCGDTRSPLGCPPRCQVHPLVMIGAGEIKEFITLSEPQFVFSFRSDGYQARARFCTRQVQIQCIFKL